MAVDPITQGQADMAAAVQLTPSQRRCLSAIDMQGLVKGKSGYRMAFRVQGASYATSTVRSLLNAGLAEKRDFGVIGLTAKGRAVLAIPYETRTEKPENRPSDYFIRERAAKRTRYQSTTKARLPYVD